MTMIKAVLLDLDDTLLRANTEAFVREYLRVLDEYWANRWTHNGFSRTLVGAVQHIMRNQPRSVELTNGAFMLDAMTQATALDLAAMQEAFAEFHRTVHPELRHCVEPEPIAPSLVQFLKDAGYAIVIATNPIFAPEATFQRLAWASLPDQAEFYALVTHSGNMHFAKPDPAYYAEIVAHIGVEPDEAVMVGDSLKNDIAPAAQIGMNTYYVPMDVSERLSELADGSGSLHDLHLQITERDFLKTLLPRPLTPSMIEPELRGNVGALFGIVSQIKAHQWNQHPDPEEWSIFQIVCHLLASERAVQRPRLKRILQEDNPFLVAPHPPPGPREAAACDRDGMEASRHFAEERRQTMEWLHNLDEKDWQRPAHHSIFGLTTLLEMAHFTAQHDRLHLNQLCQTLGRCN